MGLKQTITFYLLTSVLICIKGNFLENALPIGTLFKRSANGFSHKEVCVDNVTMEPEAYMNTVEIIQNRGYPAEVHAVQTEDGYLLEIHRIPYGLSGPSANRQPVFLQHGLESQSGDWVVNFGNQSLGYMLADVGFDVWLGNYRGNTYSRKHVSLDPDTNSSEFWNFSWQELGNYDLPACIDYVLNKTGYDKLSYIGHSMGTTGFFVLMSNRTEYNSKIKAMAALAPVGPSTFNSTNNTDISQNINAVESIFNALGIYSLFTDNDLFKFLASTACALPDPVTCENVIHNLGGLVPDPDQLNSTRLPVYVSHSPAGSSTKCFYHYEQLDYTAPYLRAYDYGASKNIDIYGQDPPPAYDFSKITAPVGLFWGQNDILADPVDIPLLESILSNMVLSYRVNNDLWHHMDFIWAMEAEFYLNTAVIDFLLSVP